MRPVYPATPLEVKAPEGRDIPEEGRESLRLSGKLVGTQSDGAGLGWARSRAGPAPSAPSPHTLAVLYNVGCGEARSMVSGWVLPRPTPTGVSGHKARELPMSRDPGRPPRGHRHREPSPTPPPKTPTLQLQPVRNQPGSEALLPHPTRGLRKSPSTSCPF